MSGAGPRDTAPRIAILGTRGIPARHGGFETFAEMFALHLAARGWQVRVYCQVPGRGSPNYARWRDVEQVFVPAGDGGPWSTVVFDWISMRHACEAGYPLLTLGYNTAIFSVLARIHRVPNAMNMDGIEWQRQKWPTLVRIWFYLNEIAGCLLANRLIADHPLIAEHLRRWVSGEKIDVIPYGAAAYLGDDSDILVRLGLTPERYVIVIARPEPENSIIEMVRAFKRLDTPCKMVVLGQFRPDRNAYHKRVLEAAGESILFPGAIYDSRDIGTLRRWARLYMHGHRVGGTNPSLVEALANGSPILAHDNRFNRSVAGDGAAYFADERECEARLRELLEDRARLAQMAAASRQRHGEAYTLEHVLQPYEDLCLRLQPKERTK